MKALALAILCLLGCAATAQNAPKPPYLMEGYGDLQDIVAKYNGRTPDEHRAKLLFEAECYRPGTDTSPMDNFDRTAAYPSMATEPMRKHWGL